ALFFFGGEFLPELRENHFVVHMRGLPGTSLPQSLATGKQVTAKLKENPAVLSVAQQAGRAELGEDTWGVEYSEFEVDLKRLEAEDAEKVQREIGDALGQNFPGFNFAVLSFLSERIKETLSGTEAAIAVKVFGDRLEDLDRSAEQIVKVMASIKGS